MWKCIWILTHSFANYLYFLKSFNYFGFFWKRMEKQWDIILGNYRVWSSLWVIFDFAEKMKIAELFFFVFIQCIVLAKSWDFFFKSVDVQSTYRTKITWITIKQFLTFCATDSRIELENAITSSSRRASLVCWWPSAVGYGG
jgi:hypothetical protein